MHRWDPISVRQLALLRRISAGEDLGGAEHIPERVSAGALRNRGLITIHRTSNSWDAETTEAGRFYLEHGHHPDNPRHKDVNASKSKRRPPHTTAAIADQRRRAAETLVQQLTRTGELTIDELTAKDETHWRRVVDYAKRHEMLPAGTRIEKQMLSPSGPLLIRLLDGPHSNTKLADDGSGPVPVPTRLSGLHPVVAALRDDKDRVVMPADVRRRTLLILQAMAAEAVRRGYDVRPRAVPDHQVRPGYSYGGRHYPSSYSRREGTILIAIGDNLYEIKIQQQTPRSDDAPRAGRLVLELWYRARERRCRWADGKRARVEDGLADVFQELERRAEEDDQRQIEEARAKAERYLQWEAAMANARARAVEAYRERVLVDLIRRRRLADDIRDYCSAVESQLADTAGDAAVSAQEWIAWARQRAEAIDPLSRAATMPEDPSLTDDDLRPYLGNWSPRGPNLQPHLRSASPQ